MSAIRPRFAHRSFTPVRAYELAKRSPVYLDYSGSANATSRGPPPIVRAINCRPSTMYVIGVPMAPLGEVDGRQLGAIRFVVRDQSRALVCASGGQAVDQERLGQEWPVAAVVSAERWQIEVPQSRVVTVAVSLTGRPRARR